MAKILNLGQELRELGARGALFRVQWEVQKKLRPKFGGADLNPLFGPYKGTDPDLAWTRHLPFADPPSVAKAFPVSEKAQETLALLANRAALGKILCFGRWMADYGSPVQWNLNPVSGRSWDSGRDLTHEIGESSLVGDVKFTWEVARFPHAYHMTRASVYQPNRAEHWAAELFAQMLDFNQANPTSLGVHWTSGQEVAFRLLSWLFALDVLLSRTQFAKSATALVSESLIDGATYIERHLDYARLAVYNNHLLSEALALYAVGTLLPDAPDATRWRQLGRRILDEEAERQFYEDGGYIQQSTNYHRVALQDLLWACALAKSTGDSPADSWLSAMERSLDLLIAHQNPADGRLPNYGPNDGSYPSPLSSCDFSDFRPTLQAVSLLTRGVREYPAGLWDEEAAWFLGPMALDAPLRNTKRSSASFPVTGYHVLRGRDESSFAMFRCGSLRDRFSQIDMLHLDVWWRGQNVLVDAGSFEYNGPRKWHDHFTRTGCHNTVSIDGLDQMLHFRQFKVLYWTRAKLLKFLDTADYALCSGEHYGYQRQPGSCIHRRSVLFLKDDVWVVADCVVGNGNHDVRLHWLGGEFQSEYDSGAGSLRLLTPNGPFVVRVMDENGQPKEGVVVDGQDDPPEGWLSRYYGEKTAVPSLAISGPAQLPTTFVSLLSGIPCTATECDGLWSVKSTEFTATFQIDSGRIRNVRVDR